MFYVDTVILRLSLSMVAASTWSLFRSLDNGLEVTSYPEDTFAGLSELTFL